LLLILATLPVCEYFDPSPVFFPVLLKRYEKKEKKKIYFKAEDMKRIGVMVQVSPVR